MYKVSCFSSFQSPVSCSDRSPIFCPFSFWLAVHAGLVLQCSVFWSCLYVQVSRWQSFLLHVTTCFLRLFPYRPRVTIHRNVTDLLLLIQIFLLFSPFRSPITYLNIFFFYLSMEVRLSPVHVGLLLPVDTGILLPGTCSYRSAHSCPYRSPDICLYFVHTGLLLLVYTAPANCVKYSMKVKSPPPPRSFCSD